MKKGNLSISILEPEFLAPDQIQQMCEIYVRHHNIEYTDCEKRIKSGFDQIVLYLDAKTQRVVGFNGINKQICKLKAFRRSVLAIYIGQIYIEKAYRGFFPLQKATMKLILREKLFRPWLLPVIWADSLTYKPYLLIAKNSHNFYPRPEKETPESYQNLLDHLGRSRYGARYDSTSGCVTKDSKLVKEYVAPILPRMMSNQYIRFYAEKNAGYEKGNGMLVIMPYCWHTVYNIVRKLSNNWIRKYGKKLNPSGKLIKVLNG